MLIKAIKFFSHEFEISAYGIRAYQHTNEEYAKICEENIETSNKSWSNHVWRRRFRQNKNKNKNETNERKIEKEKT